MSGLNQLLKFLPDRGIGRRSDPIGHLCHAQDCRPGWEVGCPPLTSAGMDLANTFSKFAWALELVVPAIYVIYKLDQSARAAELCQPVNSTQEDSLCWRWDVVNL